MILAIDAHYNDTKATVAGIQAVNFLAEEPTQTHRLEVPVVSEYESGQFYKRELPCILELLDHFQLNPDTIFVDGFVYLNNDSRPGLGMHLFDALKGETVVIGVAKTPFHSASESSSIYRGNSMKPLYVTAAGIDQNEAKRIVEAMAGAHRIPTLLKLADTESRAGF